MRRAQQFHGDTAHGIRAVDGARLARESLLLHADALAAATATSGDAAAAVAADQPWTEHGWFLPSGAGTIALVRRCMYALLARRWTGGLVAGGLGPRTALGMGGA